MEFHYAIKCERLYEKHTCIVDKVAPNSAIAGILYWHVKTFGIEGITKQDIKTHVGVCIPTLTKVVTMLDKLETTQVIENT
tara:strand:- start:529 stop:771 length:243 start_codon:yes stop_codon:yes gene_type:complete